MNDVKKQWQLIEQFCKNKVRKSIWSWPSILNELHFYSGWGCPSYNFSTFFFHVQLQIAVWALERTRRVGERSHIAEHMESRSCCLKVYCSTDSMTSRELKSHRNEHPVRGRPTRKDVDDVQNGSVHMPCERSIYERTFLWVNLSRIKASSEGPS